LWLNSALALLLFCNFKVVFRSLILKNHQAFKKEVYAPNHKFFIEKRPYGLYFFQIKIVRVIFEMLRTDSFVPIL